VAGADGLPVAGTAQPVRAVAGGAGAVAPGAGQGRVGRGDDPATPRRTRSGGPGSAAEPGDDRRPDRQGPPGQARGVVGGDDYATRMAGSDEVTTYEQLQAMTPQERHEHFLNSIVLNPADFRPNERVLVERLDELTLAREERLRGQAS